MAADLQATSFGMYNAPQLHSGDPQTAWVTIQNKNVIWFLDDAGSFTVTVYISDDPNITTSDTALGALVFSGLGAGQTQTQNFSCPRTPPLAPDVDPIRTDNRYWIGVIVDFNDSVHESDETNNANRGDGIDRVTVWGEKHLPAPLDGVNVQADTLLGTYNGEIGGNSEWMGGYDIDIMQTTMYANETRAFDVDGAATLDSYLRIYNSSWQLVASSDNGAGAYETSIGLDPFIRYTPTTTGTYYLVMSAAVNKNADPRTLAGRTTGALSQGSYTITTNGIWPAPLYLDLLDDTGVSNSDNITRDNQPTFSFFAASHLEPQVIVDGAIVGFWDSPNPDYYYQITTPTMLADGEHDVQVRGFDPATGYTTDLSAPLHITIDTTAPQLSAAMQFGYLTAPHAITATFGDDVGASLGANDVSLIDLATQAPLTDTYSYDPATRKATFRINPPANGLFPKGNFRATLSAAGITDAAGNPLSGATPLEFFFTPGDANHDRAVNSSDFNALATHFNKSMNVNFASGDFNYDGNVNALDFNLLASNYGTTLASPTASGILDDVGLEGQAQKSLFGKVSIAPDRIMEDLGDKDPGFANSR
jgi:hypothetical protein